ncbi:MAG: hypothetical protein O2968_22960 [Acidobacteria bacterium]|nr:hypothetical protein [Acidobacteriota bacterium]
MLLRIVLIAFLTAVLIPAASPPPSWIPLRWDGGPLEILRRHGGENPILTDSQKQVIERWYQPETLELLDSLPYSCLVLTWSLGRTTDIDTRQRELVSKYVELARKQDLAVLASIEFGPDWQEAVQAAAAVFDGVVLEGEFPSEAAAQALDELRKANPKAIVIPMGDWRQVHRVVPNRRRSRGAFRRLSPPLAGRSPVIHGHVTHPRTHPAHRGARLQPCRVANPRDPGPLSSKTPNSQNPSHKPKPLFRAHSKPLSQTPPS